MILYFRNQKQKKTKQKQQQAGGRGGFQSPKYTDTCYTFKDKNKFKNVNNTCTNPPTVAFAEYEKAEYKN